MIDLIAEASCLLPRADACTPHSMSHRDRIMSDAQTDNLSRASLTRYAWISIAAAVFTIGLKAVAYLLTGSVGLLSDALESVVNLIGALMALAMLTIAARRWQSLP